MKPHEEDDLNALVSAVAADGSLEPAERAGMAREAILRAERVAPSRSRTALLLIPAAAVAILAAVLVAQLGEPDRPELAGRGIALTREANLAALEDEETIRRLDAAGPRHYAVIAGGRLIGVGNLAPLLAVAEEEEPNATHRFVFRVNSRGDRRFATKTHRAPAVGREFHKLEDILENEERWPVEEVDGAKRMEIRTGEPSPMLSPRNAVGVPYLLAPDFTGGLLLPDDMHLPLYEIPGVATVVSESGEERTYRRYLVGIGFSLKPHGRFVMGPPFEGKVAQNGCSWWGIHEAIGTGAPEPRGSPIGDRIWPPVDQAVLAESFATGRPVLELRGDAPEAAFAGEAVRALLDRFVPAIGEDSPEPALLVLGPTAPPGGGEPVHRHPERAAHGAGWGSFEWGRLRVTRETTTTEIAEFLEAALGARVYPWNPMTPAPEWVRIPAGAYMSGPADEAVPVHVEGYEILKYEVTNAMWIAWLRSKRLEMVKPDAPIPAAYWNRPVTGVSYEEAKEFCEEYLAKLPGCEGARLPSSVEWEKAARGPSGYSWAEARELAEKAGRRIPTEEEWEKAARGPAHVREFPWGWQSWPSIDGSSSANFKAAGLGGACEVTTFKKNDVSPFGVVGMAGNAAEFVTGVEGPARRGGSYLVDFQDAKVSTETPVERERGYPDVGFRAVRPVGD